MKYRILISEDDPQLSNAWKRFLEPKNIFTLKEYSFKLLKPKFSIREWGVLRKLKDQEYSDESSFLEAVEELLGVLEKEKKDLLLKCVSRKSFEVDVGCTGVETQRYWENFPYDLVLLDLITPEIHGNDLLAQIKKQQPWTQVIIITGHGKEKDQLKALHHHAYAYLKKPVDHKIVYEKIKMSLQDRDIAILNLETMVETSEDPSQPILDIGEESYSPQRLFDEVRMGNETGMEYLEELRKILIEFGNLP